MGWGASWDLKHDLASKIVDVFSGNALEGLDAEKADIRDLVNQPNDELRPMYELEIRAQGVQKGLIADSEDMANGSEFLDSEYFPYSSKIAKGSVSTNFANDCHDENGRFCETHGVVHNPTQSAPETPKKTGWFTKFKEDFKRGAAAETARIAADKAEKQSHPQQPVEAKNDFGFTEGQLKAEKADIAKQFAAHSMVYAKRYTDRIDAETRAQAVLQGRIATKGEIKHGREKARSANWGGLIGLGLLAHHIAK